MPQGFNNTKTTVMLVDTAAWSKPAVQRKLAGKKLPQADLNDLEPAKYAMYGVVENRDTGCQTKYEV